MPKAMGPEHARRTRHGVWTRARRRHSKPQEDREGEGQRRSEAWSPPPSPGLWRGPAPRSLGRPGAGHCGEAALPLSAQPPASQPSVTTSTPRLGSHWRLWLWSQEGWPALQS